MSRWIIVAVLGLGCTKSPQANKRSTYNCDTNPAECNGGVDPTSSGTALDFTVPETVAANTDFDISWGAVSGAATYDLYIGRDEKCTDTIVALKDETVTTKKISITDAGTYYACLDAKNASGVKLARKEGYKITVTSSSSNPVFTAAANLKIVADSTSGPHSSTDDDTTIYFVWDAASDSANGISSYTLNYYASANCTGSINAVNPGSALNYTFSSAAFSTTYSFEVVATNGKSETKKSSCSASTTIDFPVHNITFTTAGNYTYDNTLISISGGVAALLAITQVYDDNTSGEFGTSKAHNNTTWDSDHLELKNAGSPDPRPLPNDFYYGVDSTGLVARVPFDDPWIENGGYYRGDLGNNALLITSAGNKSVKGKHGRAFKGSYAQIADSTALRLQTLTIAVWVKTTDSGGCDFVRKRASDATNNYRLRVAMSGKPNISARAGGIDNDVLASGTTTVNDGNWHFVVGTISATEGRIYVNGNLEATDSTVSGALHNDNNAVNIGLSCDDTTSIDELSIFSRALTTTEIATLYQNQVKNFTHDHWTEAPGLMDGNILLLHMEETSGNLIDFSGLGNNAAPVGSPTYAQTGKVGNAVDFSSDYFTITDDSLWDLPTNITVSAWVKRDAGCSGAGIVMHDLSDYKWLLYCSNSDIPQFYVRTASGISNTDAAPALASGQWYHMVGTYDKSLGSDRLKMYVDGVLVSTDNGYNEDIQAGDEGVTIGRWSANYWPGLIDEVAVWNRTLSAQEIQTIYNLQSGNYRGNVHELPNDQSQTVDDWFPMNGNVLLMHLNETSIKDSGTNPSVYDYSGQGNSGAYNAGDDGLEKSVNGQLGKGMDFDGTDDEIHVTSSSELQLSSFTIGAWVKLDSLPSDETWRMFAGKGGDGDATGDNHNYALGISRLSGWCSIDSIVVLYEDTGGNNTEVCYDYTNLKLNTWYHIYGTHDAAADTLSIYVNGNKVASIGTATATPETNTQVFSIGDTNATGASPEHFDGSIDEVAVWNRALTDDEIKKIYDYQSGKYSGTFTSNVMDTGTASASWTTLAWNMIRPYGKALSASSDLSSSYTALPNDTLMNENIIYMNFDETAPNLATGGNDIEDYSGKGHHGADSGTPTYKSVGKFNYALDFAASSSEYVSITNSTDFDIAEGTVSLWFRTDGRFGSDPNDRAGIFSRHSSNCDENGFTTGMLDSNGKLYIRMNTSGCGAPRAYVESTNSYNDNQWHHLVVIFRQGSGEANQMYIDGAFDIGANNSGAWSFGSQVIYIARSANNNDKDYAGLIDEVGLWNRALSASEIQELYRRGASRIRYQVRSCDASGCDDEAWIVPNNSMTPYSSYGEFFSELHNTTTSNPSLTFGGFGSHTVSNNQFFQWKAYLDTSDTSEIPELQSVTIGPAHYYGANPTVVTSNSLTFSSLKSFSETSSIGTVKYQLSNDGGTTWYWYNSAWTTTTTGYSESSSASDINTNIATFPVGSGSLQVKAFLNSAAAGQATSLDNVAIQYAP